MGKLKIISFIVAALFVACFIVSVSLLVVYASPYSCGALSISSKDQTFCNISASDSYVELNVDITDKQPKDVTTYIFSKQPKKLYVDEMFNFSVDHKMYASFTIPFALSNKVSFVVDMSRKIDVEYVGKSNKRTEVIYSEEGIQNGEGHFTIDQDLSNCHFILTSSDYFSGDFRVTVGLQHYDVKSVATLDKCKSYPCYWDLTDPRFANKDLWVVTDNAGSESYSISGQLHYNTGLWIGVGIGILTLAIIGVTIFFVLALVMKD